MAKITIYSTPTCHFCHMAKDWFTENNVPFTDYNVQTDLEKRQEMTQKSGGMAVPVFDIDGEVIVGFDKEKIAALVGLPA
ncbi:MAG: hypothetical protein JWL75_386 [Parcubacteria group bacterium]|nr:hypothetical protein [Parcubacteria group bacterium]